MLTRHAHSPGIRRDGRGRRRQVREPTNLPRPQAMFRVGRPAPAAPSGRPDWGSPTIGLEGLFVSAPVGATGFSDLANARARLATKSPA